TMTRRTLVILDEIHHAGDSRSWGDGTKAAFEPAVRRLSLTGTPFRSDDNPIPFVAYERGDDGLPRSRADTTYGYADALHDGVVVLSADAGAASKIASFAASEQRWLVAVRMVSEGVDLPRLAVGVYATSASTPLIFAQAIGRFVRARLPGETATVFLPSVPH